jgi:hypothetical protein
MGTDLVERFHKALDGFTIPNWDGCAALYSPMTKPAAAYTEYVLASCAMVSSLVAGLDRPWSGDMGRTSPPQSDAL